jgi:hypothetical protein
MKLDGVPVAMFVLFLAACGGEQYQAAPAAGPSAPTGACTGLLINAQEAGRKVHAGALETWTVVDEGRNKIFGSDDILAEYQARKGVMFGKRYAEAVAEGRGLHLGKNFYEVQVMKCEYDEATWKKAVYMVSDATAAEIRAIPNLGALVQRANIVLLMGLVGD